jgi:hypothetical protein
MFEDPAVVLFTLVAGFTIVFGLFLLSLALGG